MLQIPTNKTFFKNFFQSMMSLKEKKDMEDQFKKVQKPWAKLLTKVNKAKSDYHNACKAEKTGLFTFRIFFIKMFLREIDFTEKDNSIIFL